MQLIDQADAPHAMIDALAQRFYPDDIADAMAFHHDHGAVALDPAAFGVWYCETLRMEMLPPASVSQEGLHEALLALVAMLAFPTAKPTPAPSLPPGDRYVLHAGYVRSKHDGDLHRVGAVALAHLYGLSPGQWVAASTLRAGIGRTIPPAERWRHLYPRDDGAYSLPRTVTGMEFGRALTYLKDGKRLTRRGWNSPGQWVALSPGFNVGPDRVFSPAIRLFLEQQAAKGDAMGARFAPYFLLRNAQGEFVPWQPSTGDVLAEDWETVE